MNYLYLTGTPSPSSVFAVNTASLQKVSALVELPNFKVVPCFRTPGSQCTIPYEQLCEIHMFLHLVELVDASCNCFPIKVIHNNMVPGLLTPLCWGRKVTSAISGLLLRRLIVATEIPTSLRWSMKVASYSLARSNTHEISLTSRLRRSL